MNSRLELESDRVFNWKKNNEPCLDIIEYDLNIVYNKRGGGRGRDGIV